MCRRTSSKLTLWLIILAFILTMGKAEATWKKDGKLVKRKNVATKDKIKIDRLTYLSDRKKVHGLLFVPEGSSRVPVVVFCHDGISGISKEHKLASIKLAKAGFVVFSPSYRGEDDSEGEIEIAKGEVRDVLNAIKMLSQVKEVDRNNVALVGASHGALISVLAASRTNKVKALVSAYGVMNIYKWWDYLKKNDMVGKDKITRQTYGKGPKDRPVSFAIRNAVSYAKNIKCPVLILQGGKDKVVPPEQAKYLKQVLDKYKIPNTMKIYPDCLHGFLVYVPFLEEGVEKEERQQTRQAWKVMIRFLKENLNEKN